MALFHSMTGIKAVHVPYKGSAPALVDLIGGRITMMFDNTVLPHVQAGKLRALGVSTGKRLRVLPEVPTITEAGVPGYEMAAWQSIVPTGGTPRPVISKLNTEIVQILGMPEVEARLTADGGQITTSTPEEFAAYIMSELERFAKIVKEAGVRLE